MSTTKLASGPFTIHTINSAHPITLDAANVYINGNLFVTGNTTTVETVDTVVYDSIITLNGNVTTGSPTADAGIEVRRGSSPNASLIWNETIDKWQITGDGVTYANILASTGSGTGITQVADDTAPTLGGNLNLRSYEIFSNVGHLKFNGNVQVNVPAVIPTANVANATIVYASSPNSAGSGLFVLNSKYTTAGEELVTKTKALAFSLLF